jgi:hypothetical protein
VEEVVTEPFYTGLAKNKRLRILGFSP